MAFDGDGNFLANEAEIVNFVGNMPLSDFYLLPLDELYALDKQGNYTQAEIERISKIPAVSKEALKALREADLIIFWFRDTVFFPTSFLPNLQKCNTKI